MRFVVLGNPVAHSLSPIIQNSAFAVCGIEATYGYRTVDKDGMIQAFGELRSGELSGANVTMPHKQLAALLSDALDPGARRAGAVNTLIPTHDGIIGANTDIAGVRLAAQWNHLPADSPILVLGAGGAAAAALLAFEGRDIAISARRLDAAVASVERTGVKARAVEWGSAVRNAVVVNATPIGMDGIDEKLPSQVVAAMGSALDLVYSRSDTPLVSEARKRGLPCAPGIDMLVGQAAEAFTLWTGIDAPVTEMRDAAAAPRPIDHTA